jgi:hypothetical protein
MTTLATDQFATCRYCLIIIAESEAAMTCPGCGTLHHQKCWDELGGCTTYGCPQMVETKKVEEQAVTYWGETEKTCPVCAETIPVAAVECPLCRASFGDIRPMSRQDIIKPAEEDWIKSYRRGAICLLVLSAIGITSPLSFIIGGIWYLMKRDKFRQVPAVRALVLISFGIDVVYALMLPLGWAVFQLKGVG